MRADRAVNASRAVGRMALGSALALMACVTSRGRDSDVTPCTGVVELVVRNNTRASLDLYRNASPTPVFVASLPPGTSRVPVGTHEQGATYMVRGQGSEPRTAFVGKNSLTSGVELEEICRSES